MKSLIFIPVVIVVTFLAQMVLPWWIIAPIAFMICYVFNPGKFSDKNFDVPVSGILGGLIGNVSQGAVFFLTGITGGLVAGLSGLMGDWTRTLSKKSQN